MEAGQGNSHGQPDALTRLTHPWEAAKEQAATEKKVAEKARMPSPPQQELAALFGPNSPRLM